MNRLLISVSGVRGVYGESLTLEVVRRYAYAFGLWLGGGKVVIGRDSRPSGADVLASSVEGLAAARCDVVDIGIVPTPTVGVAVPHFEARGGIVITASHNPEEWNALKLLDAAGEFIKADEGEEVRRLFESEKVPAQTGEVTRTSAEGSVSVHIDRIKALPIIDPERIGRRNPRVALDGVNGGAAEAGCALLDALGVRAVPIHCRPDLPFPHDPEPKPDHLKDLCRAVPAAEADLGFALDPDGDRLALVDETGRPLSEEHTLALAADFWLSRRPGPLAVNSSTSRMIDHVAGKHGVAVHRSPVGEAHVVAKMKQVGAVLGGEGNGGVIVPDVHYGRDGLAAMALILQYLVEDERPLSSLADELPALAMVKAKVDFPRDLPREPLASFLSSLVPGEMEFEDGFKITGENAWIHVRRSNTEGVVRIIAEAALENEANDLVRSVVSWLENPPGGIVGIS